MKSIYLVLLLVTLAFASVDNTQVAQLEGGATYPLPDGAKSVMDINSISLNARAVPFSRLTGMIAQNQAQLTASSSECDICTTATAILTAAADNAATLQQLTDMFNYACKLAFINEPEKLTKCYDIGKLAFKAAPIINKVMHELDWDALGFCSVIVPVCKVPCCSASNVPEQVHIALGETNDQMTVTWATLTTDGEPTLLISETDNFAEDHITKFVGTSWTHTVSGWVGQMHSAKATGLKLGHKYYYRVGWEGNWSKTYYFKTLSANAGSTASPLHVVQIGDVDYGDNGRDTLNALQKYVKDGKVDIIFHVGDISYADGYEKHFDQFMRDIEPIAAYVPYMVVPGNHEFWFNFESYRSRFRMPGGDDTVKNMFYSFRINDAVHFQMLNSETAIDTADFTDQQIAWMKKDLATAQTAKWRISMAHRPLYCTDSRKLQCETFAGILRMKAETVLASGKVDLYLAGHIHAYERSFPVYSGIVMGKTYKNTRAPTYITNGSGGNREAQRTLQGDQNWSAVTSSVRGYGFVTISGNTMVYKFVESSSGTVIDTVQFTK